MNCHSTSNSDDTAGTNSSQAQQGSGGMGRMGLLMLLCCLAPLAAIAAVTIFGVPFSGVLSFAVVLLCPLMMLFMMFGGHGHGSNAAADQPATPVRVSKNIDEIAA